MKVTITDSPNKGSYDMHRGRYYRNLGVTKNQVIFTLRAWKSKTTEIIDLTAGKVFSK